MEKASLPSAWQESYCTESTNDGNHGNHRPEKNGARGDVEEDNMWDPCSCTQVHACLSSFLPPNRELIKNFFKAHYHQPFLIASFWERFATASLTV